VTVRLLRKESVSAEHLHPRLEGQFEEDTYRSRPIRRWCQYVRQGREELHDEVLLGRPPSDFFDVRVPALPDEQPFHSVYPITDHPGLSHSIIVKYLRESLGMKIIHLRWISHQLTESLRHIRVETFRELPCIP
jgi:hypothetical protein